MSFKTPLLFQFKPFNLNLYFLFTLYFVHYTLQGN